MITAVEAEPGMVVAPARRLLRLAHDGPRDVVFSVPDKLALIRQLAACRPLQRQALGRRQPGAAGQHPRGSRRGRSGDAPSSSGPDAGAGQAGPDRDGASSCHQTAGVAKLPLTALKEQKGRSIVWVVDRQA